MEYGKLIASRMEEAREYTGISIAELGRRADINNKRLWYILNGQRQMRAEEFIKLCAVLDLDMTYFLTQEMRSSLEERRRKAIRDFGTGYRGIRHQFND